MRKHQQRQILELIQTMKEALAVKLYARSQDCVWRIGEFIECIEGGNRGVQTIALLKEYHELLRKADKGEIGEEPLLAHLMKIGNSVKSELKPNKIEIAFLSYKASMADSIESIYLAAKADPDCDAYWIPIPYFEYQADGSLGQMHYEGADCYGGNIECTDWREYDIKARHPDAIFTFAPYDAGNYVTSVHPDFYCERLRELTDLLVYCPYFVAIGDVAEIFCTIAGCVFAHKVIVQSEKIRDTYVRVFKARYGDEFGKPEDKFVALGSPKFDKVIDARREDFTLPDQWRALIGDRKTIFYNTGIDAILQGNERYLKKLKFVLDAFRGRDDVVLWWRPHPLSEATYKSMRPRLLEEYERIVADYKHGGWGIYDDTADLHRAIAWSDAYYGDWSSVASLFWITGKSITIQDIGKSDRIASEPRALTICPLQAAKAETGKYYGFNYMGSNLLFELDFNDNTARILCEDKSHPRTALFTRVLSDVIYGKVISLPHSGNSIFEYDLCDGSATLASIDDDFFVNRGEGVGGSFSKRVFFKNKYYCFSLYCKAIIVYDIVSKSISYEADIFNKTGLMRDDGATVKRPIYLSESSEDGWVDLIFIDSDTLIGYNLQSGELSVKARNEILKSCIRAEFDGQYYWLLTKSNDTIVRWNPVTGEDVRYSVSPHGFSAVENRSGSYDFIDCGKYLLIFPIKLDNERAYDKICRFEKATGQTTEYHGIPSFVGGQFFVDDIHNLHRFFPPRRYGESVYIYAYPPRAVFEIDIKSGRATEHKFSVHPDSYDAYRKWQFTRENVLSTDDAFKGMVQEEYMLGSFFDYIDYIADEREKQSSPLIRRCAEPILRNVKEALK